MTNDNDDPTYALLPDDVAEILRPNAIKEDRAKAMSIFLKSYHDTDLNFGQSCKCAGVSRGQVKSWMLQWKPFREQVEAIEEDVLDDVETHALGFAKGTELQGHPGMLKDVLLNMRRRRWKPAEDAGQSGTVKIVISQGMNAKLEGSDAQV